ncbi:hypothetical protein [Niabella ginsengisoli]|uniref:Uncharacterized protein n=1 Tax=Niabella ginsengisoli TaxID=522298 RepID=A0ABS9SFN0_9BACT|nr:hypothetical protein [Niabella ginsengisoli]MCH5597172.1 hypothetical protein [Niabella ginsengisoli]
MAVILLLVFSVSVTPKIYFHDLASKHTDYSCSGNHSSDVQLTAYKFNCGFVNVIAVSPFLAVKEIDSELSISFAEAYSDTWINNWLAFQSDYSQRRGPPALIF